MKLKEKKGHEHRIYSYCLHATFCYRIFYLKKKVSAKRNVFYKHFNFHRAFTQFNPKHQEKRAKSAHFD